MPIVVLAIDTEYEHCMWILEKNQQHTTLTSTTNEFVDMDMYLVTSDFLPSRRLSLKEERLTNQSQRPWPRSESDSEAVELVITCTKAFEDLESPL